MTISFDLRAAKPMSLFESNWKLGLEWMLDFFWFDFHHVGWQVNCESDFWSSLVQHGMQRATYHSLNIRTSFWRFSTQVLLKLPFVPISCLHNANPVVWCGAGKGLQVGENFQISLAGIMDQDTLCRRSGGCNRHTVKIANLYVHFWIAKLLANKRV